jgi:hypothetical protein
MWTVRLTDSQRDTLTAFLRAQSELGPALSGALEQIELARWDELPDAALPWDCVAELAEEQGIGEADVVWDLVGGLPVGRRTQRPSMGRPTYRDAAARLSR